MSIFDHTQMLFFVLDKITNASFDNSTENDKKYKLHHIYKITIHAIIVTCKYSQSYYIFL